MELETINKLYLELSQVATVKTSRELELEDLLTSARCIAQRQGLKTAWKRFDERLQKAGIGSVTAKVFKVMPNDIIQRLQVQRRRRGGGKSGGRKQ